MSIENYPASGNKYLCFTAEHSHPDQKIIQLRLFINGKLIGERTIDSDFSTYAFPFEDTGDLQFEFKASTGYKAPGDPRELSVKMKDIEVLLPPDADIFPRRLVWMGRRRFISFSLDEEQGKNQSCSARVQKP